MSVNVGYPHVGKLRISLSLRAYVYPQVLYVGSLANDVLGVSPICQLTLRGYSRIWT
jgi:hypothetical protein